MATAAPFPDFFDAIVIGTGFGGAVTACRLVEAGFKVCVLERGRRYGKHDFPTFPSDDLFARSNSLGTFTPLPDVSRWLWRRDRGVYDVRDLGDVVSVQAAGYGGGSLIYANVHLRPPREVFDGRWPEAYQPGADGGWDLDSYFDLAAYMLRVSPIPRKLAKTLQLQRAAGAVNRTSEQHWFRTPLAVNFDVQGDNAFGREQEPCDMRGRCWLGCDRHAKNTLDLNYLARMENANGDGVEPPNVRTLAEVESIARVGEGMFAVSYDDLLERHTKAGPSTFEGAKAEQRRVVTGRYVFLCAGALNTTELLFRSPGLSPHRPKKRRKTTPLGSHYFPNADSLAAVFDCERPHEADYGPTITAAIRVQAAEQTRALYFECGRVERRAGRRAGVPAAGDELWGKNQDGVAVKKAVLAAAPILDWGTWQVGATGTLVLEPGHGEFEPGDELVFSSGATARASSRVSVRPHWFLAEDGGYPPDLQPLVGMFQSPLWLRRNRYLEQPPAQPAEPAQIDVSSLEQAYQAFQKRVAPHLWVRQTPQRRASAPHPYIRSFARSLAGTARRSRMRSPASTPLNVAGPLAGEFGNFFPDWFVKALVRDREQIIAGAAAMALPMIGRLLDEMSQGIAQRFNSDTLGFFDSSRQFDTFGTRPAVIIRGMLRQALQALAGSEAAIASNAATVLLGANIPGSPPEVLDRLGDLLLWALAFDSSDHHAGVVLVMGRDLHRGRLDITGSGEGRLTATLPPSGADTLSVTQERALRLIAREWRGELRANPAWSTFGKRVTVHSQGGCPMGDSAATSVTGPSGEVHGCDGLYVMDAAAFPASVGVNPSAAITAIAEWKIEQFIRRHGKRAAGAAWESADKTHAIAWANANRATLDPLNQREMPDSDLHDAPLLGLTFTEKMIGSLANPTFTERELGGRAPADFEENLDSFVRAVPQFARAEDAGLRRRNIVDLTLHATVDNLQALIDTERGAAPPKIKLKGEVRIDRRTYNVAEANSYLEMFLKPKEDGVARRFFRYHLELELTGDESNAGGNWARRLHLDGVKLLCNEPGFDMWTDTSTLFIRVKGHGLVERFGIMRVSVEDFVRHQMRSFEVTGTDDVARKSWALMAFYRYFIGELAAVYIEHAGMLKALLAKLATENNV